MNTTARPFSRPLRLKALLYGLDNTPYLHVALRPRGRLDFVLYSHLAAYPAQEVCHTL